MWLYQIFTSLYVYLTKLMDLTPFDFYNKLHSQSLKEMGTKDLSFVQLNQLIGRKTGGISVYPFTSSIRGKEDPCCCMVVRGKAMAGQAEDLFNLVILLAEFANESIMFLFNFLCFMSPFHGTLWWLLRIAFKIPHHVDIRDTFSVLSLGSFRI